MKNERKTRPSWVRKNMNRARNRRSGIGGETMIHPRAIARSVARAQMAAGSVQKVNRRISGNWREVTIQVMKKFGGRTA